MDVAWQLHSYLGALLGGVMEAMHVPSDDEFLAVPQLADCTQHCIKISAKTRCRLSAM